jgi:hypothetical protein
MNWECNDCGNVHQNNPSQCSACGHTVLSPSSNSESESSGAKRDELLLALLVLGAALAAGYAYWTLELDTTQPTEEMNNIGLDAIQTDDVRKDNPVRELDPRTATGHTDRKRSSPRGSTTG